MIEDRFDLYKEIVVALGSLVFFLFIAACYGWIWACFSTVTLWLLVAYAQTAIDFVNCLPNRIVNLWRNL